MKLTTRQKPIKIIRVGDKKIGLYGDRGRLYAWSEKIKTYIRLETTDINVASTMIATFGVFR